MKVPGSLLSGCTPRTSNLKADIDISTTRKTKMKTVIPRRLSSKGGAIKSLNCHSKLPPLDLIHPNNQVCFERPVPSRFYDNFARVGVARKARPAFKAMCNN